MPINKSTFIFAASALLLASAAMSQVIVTAKEDNTPIAPQIPDADRHEKGKVFLERADYLRVDPNKGDFQILVGNVEFRKGDMFMYCDSAYFYDKSNSLDAFSNVRMEQGDTLFVYGDELNYDGQSELAVLHAWPGKKVKLINRDVTLETDVFNYDMSIELGYYEVWGTLTDKNNTLYSLQGEYSPSTKDANFYTDVVLTGISEKDSDTVYIYTDTLAYNTDTHIAELTCPSRVVSKDGIVYTHNGIYNTQTNIAHLYDRSLVKTNDGNTLTADTIIYRREEGIGEAFGRMILTDSVNQSSIEGDYGFYNQIADSSYVTGRARALEYSQKDTLYLHGGQISSYLLPDSTHAMVAYPHVRFYRSDMQGLCDSMIYLEKDSILYMERHPIVWSGSRQIFGNQIKLHLNDSTVDKAILPNSAFVAEHIAEEFYNQLSGKEMVAYFENSELRHIDVSGNVEGIMLPMENDSTYNKIAHIESSFLKADFEGQEMKEAVMWPETSGTVTPLYLAKKSIFYLPKFKWYGVLRPTDPNDIFRIPDEMTELLSEPIK